MSAMAAPAVTVDELRNELHYCETEAKRLRDEADQLDRRARGLRVTIHKAEQDEAKPAPPVAPAVDYEAKLRDYAATVAFFAETEAIQHTGMPKAKLRRLCERLIGEGKMVAIGPASSRRYAWVKPDHQADAPVRAATPVRRRGATIVAGTGKGKKLGADREVRQIVAKLEKQGATARKMGDGHIEVSHNGEVITMSATPRKKGMSRTKSQARNRLGLSA